MQLVDSAYRPQCRPEPTEMVTIARAVGVGLASDDLRLQIAAARSSLDH